MARVDTRAMLVRDGAAAIAFAADCGAGTATLDPQGEPHVLRLLCWREKCGLARFAEAGTDFLEMQFVAISGGAAPGDPVRREALSALAFWLHGPDPLPFDAALLGEVTLDLCGAFGIGPTALAALPAPEVEMLWRARQVAEPAPAGRAETFAHVVNSGMTCIVIEADPADGIAVSRDEHAPISATPSPPVSDSAVRANRDPNAASEIATASEPAADAAQNRGLRPIAGDPPAKPAVRRGERSVQSQAAPEAQSGRAERPGFGPRRQAPRFRLRPESERAPGTDPDGPNSAFPGEGWSRVASGFELPDSASAASMQDAGLPRREGSIGPNSTPNPVDGPGAGVSIGGKGADRNASSPFPTPAPAPVRSAMAGPVRGASPPPELPGRPSAPRADPQSEPSTPAAAAISAMVSAAASPGFRGAAPRPAQARPAHPITTSAPAPAIDSRLGALVDIVTRAAAPRADAASDPDALIESFDDRLADAVDPRLGALVDMVTRAAWPRVDAASDPDALIESFGDRLADAVAELGLVGAE